MHKESTLHLTLEILNPKNRSYFTSSMWNFVKVFGWSEQSFYVGGVLGFRI